MGSICQTSRQWLWAVDMAHSTLASLPALDCCFRVQLILYEDILQQLVTIGTFRLPAHCRIVHVDAVLVVSAEASKSDTPTHFLTSTAPEGLSLL